MIIMAFVRLVLNLLGASSGEMLQAKGYMEKTEMLEMVEEEKVKDWAKYTFAIERPLASVINEFYLILFL